MNILFCGNNWLAWKILSWLKSKNENIVGVVIHPPGKQKYVDNILKSADLPDSLIFDGSKLKEPFILNKIYS